MKVSRRAFLKTTTGTVAAAEECIVRRDLYREHDAAIFPKQSENCRHLVVCHYGAAAAAFVPVVMEMIRTVTIS